MKFPKLFNWQRKIAELEADLQHLSNAVDYWRDAAGRNHEDTDLLNFRDDMWDASWPLEIHGKSAKGTSYRDVLRKLKRAHGR